MLQFIMNKLKVPYVVITKDGAPYLTRYFLNGRPKYANNESGRIYLHHFHSSDRDRALHNHPWAGTSLILSGGYDEERMTKVGSVGGYYRDGVSGDWLPNVDKYSKSRFKTFYPGMINKIGLNDFHCATLLDEKKGAWTLFFTGPRVRNWGFLERATGKFTEWRQFLAEEDKNYRDGVKTGALRSDR